MDAIVMENLRLGSWELDDSEGYCATEHILQHRISQFDVGPLNSVFIRKFFNIHMGKHYGEDSKDLDLQADVLSENIPAVVTEFLGSHAMKHHKSEDIPDHSHGSSG